MNYASDIGGDLWNPPLLHGCLGCGAYVQPAADDSIPALCDTCAAAPEIGPVVLLWRAGGKNIAPPVEPETPWARLMRLAEQGVDGNGIAVRPADRIYTRYHVTSQSRPGVAHTVSVQDGWVRCTCPATGPCAHIGALYRWLVAQQAAALSATSVAERAA